MNSFKNPVGEGPRDPYEKYRVEPIEERSEKGEESFSEKEKVQEEKRGLFAFLLGLFQKTVQFFFETRKAFHPTQIEITHNLKHLKTAFEIIKKEDRSQDVVFLNQLSQAWIRVLELGLRFGNEEAATLFKTLVKKISHYPESLPHTFGYYLTEYAGQKWVPFPYMELIQKIHHEHELSPESSSLTEWTSILDQLIAILQKEP